MERARKLGQLKTTKGKHWYNDGVKNIMALKCPDGFVPGYIPSAKQRQVWNSLSKLSEGVEK